MGNELERADKGFMGLLKAMTMTNTDRVNSVNRSVVEYKPCGVDAILPNKASISVTAPITAINTTAD